MTTSSQHPEIIICLTESLHEYMTLQRERKKIWIYIHRNFIAT